MRRADRLFQILQILRRDRISTAARLARELGISQRTLYRDMKDLQDSGVPLESEAGVGYRLPRTCDLPPLMFQLEELEALALGARMVEAWGGGAFEEAARSLLLKVSAVLPEGLRPLLQAPHLLVPDFHVPGACAAHLDDLRRAVRERRRVAVSYLDALGQGTERILRPLGLAYWGSAWSLAAWCELREDFRNFRLDRLARVEVLESRFEMDEGRDLGAYLARANAEGS